MLHLTCNNSSFAGLDFVFHMFFLLKYCKSLEEGSFRGRSADFLWMLMLGGALLTAIAPFVHVQFLGSSLTFMMVYVWGRRHQYVNLSFLGIFNFTAPYLPWVLLAFSLMLGSSPVVDLMGMAAGRGRWDGRGARRSANLPTVVAAVYFCNKCSLVVARNSSPSHSPSGHVYYFLEDVYPRMTHRRPLKTPGFVRALFPADEPIVMPPPVPPPQYVPPAGPGEGVPAQPEGAAAGPHAHQD